MSLIKKPVFWIGVVGVGIAGWILTNPESHTSNQLGRTTRKKVAAKTSEVFTEEDYKAKFAPMQISFKNSFTPIVARRDATLGGGDGAANEIPLEFTGGNAGWVYTGSAEIDGQISALLENRTTGDGVFLKPGERWKSAVVVKILGDGVVMRGPSGEKTFALVDDSSKAPVATVNPNTNVVPPARVSNVPGGLSGPIGRGNFPGGISVMPQGGQAGGGFMPMPPTGSDESLQDEQ